MKRTVNGKRRIALVTRTHTINQGNQALSVAWREYLTGRYPNANVSLFERVPKYLRRYSVSVMASVYDPIAAFDEIATELLRKMPNELGLNPSARDVTLDAKRRQVVRCRRLRQKLRLRSRIASFNLGAKDYLNRLGHLTEADLVVVNPAGEFHSSSTDTALLYLLEARCAQLAGCRTAIVNLSFEVKDPIVASIADHVFSSCDFVEFRDEESREQLMKLCLACDYAVLPDAVIMSPVSPTQRIRGHGIALAINWAQILESNYIPEVRLCIKALSEQGTVTLTSNEWATDYPLWEKNFGNDEIAFEGHGLNYDEYACFLSGFDVVVSSRLHTCVLGMLAGAVVVPIECGTFKLTGFFNQIGMPREPILIGSAGWQSKLLDQLSYVRANRGARLANQEEKIDNAVARLRSGLDRAFGEDLI
jgi:polysaccharide pyruvyl transferase WcaK-like protein